MSVNQPLLTQRHSITWNSVKTVFCSAVFDEKYVCVKGASGCALIEHMLPNYAHLHFFYSTMNLLRLKHHMAKSYCGSFNSMIKPSADIRVARQM